MRRAFLIALVSSSVAVAAVVRERRAGATPAGPVEQVRARVADILLPPGARIIADRVGAGATLSSLLRAHQVAEREIADLVSRAASVFDVRKLRTAQPYRLEETLDGLVRKFQYEIDGNRILTVSRPTRGTGPFVADIELIPKTKVLTVVRGSIDRDAPSLFAAMEASGETIDLSVALADIFGGEIDFSTEVQPGDTFEILVEKEYRDTHEFAGYGPILAAEFDNAGRRLHALRFASDGQPAAYYDEHGVSMRRFFLASPLKFQPVVTSGFSRNRFHPILREYRPHLGVDYRAPEGAPVIAVADGVVVEAGTSGGAGRMVHLRHANGFESEYLHLSAIGVRAGAHVQQGQLIGRVGMTGLATGPHLDFRLKRNGAFINPLTAHRAMPPAEPVPPAQMAAFAADRDQLLEKLSSTVAASTPAVATR